jgi:hypothetical protein
MQKISKKSMPSILQGFQIYEGCFSVIKPEASTNLVTNPQFFIDTTGYTTIGAGTTISRQTDYQRRGVYGLLVNPGLGVTGGVYYTAALTSGENYSFSADIWGHKDVNYRLYIADNAGTRVSEYVEFAGYDFWIRKSVSYTATASANHRLIIERVTQTSDALDFYTDGWQLENLSYATTYIDGEQTGYIDDQEAYGWNGLAHGSTSFRIEDTRAGGRETFLDDQSIGLQIIEIMGLGMGPITNLAIPLLSGGGFYDRTVNNDREFVLVGRMDTNQAFPTLHRRRTTLIELLDADVSETQQPMQMRYRPINDCGEQMAEDVRIICVYASGLEGDFVNTQQDQVSLVFTNYIEGVEDITENGIELTYTETSSSYNRCFKITKEGGFDNLNGGAINVYSIKRNPVNNLVYFGGSFTTIGGVAANKIAAYDPDADTFSAMGVGCDATVFDIDFDAYGHVYVCGGFHNAGGIACNHVARWNIDSGTWENMGAGPGSDGYSIAVNRLEVQPNFRVGHNFNNGATYDVVDQVEVSATGAYVWSTYATNPTTTSITGNKVFYSRINNDFFYTVSYQNGADNDSEIWHDDGSGATKIGDVTFTGGATIPGTRCIEQDERLNLYIGGRFDSHADISGDAGSIIVWDGAVWKRAGLGLFGGSLRTVDDLLWDDGVLYAVGREVERSPDSAPYTEFSSSIVAYNGTEWNSFSAGGCTALPNNITIIEKGRSSSFYIASFFNSLIYPSLEIIDSSTDKPVYPKIDYKGPLKVWNTLRDLRGMIYEPMVVGIGEKVLLDLDTSRYSITSSIGETNRQRYLSETSEGGEMAIRNGNNYMLAYATEYVKEEGDTNDIASDWEDITGITSYNTSNGRLYLRGVVDGGGNLQITFYTDAARTQSVANTPNNAVLGSRAVNAVGGSGIGGTITIDTIPGAGNYDWVVTWGLIRMRWNNRHKGLDSVIQW